MRKHEEMTVRDFIKIEEDIDVYDDVCEELGIAFCGPMILTDLGKEKFKDVLDFKITIYRDPYCGDSAVIHIDSEDEKIWKKNLKKAIEFFHSLAGYCSEEDYEKWFIEG